MENYDRTVETLDELPREEALVRLYQLKHQLDMEDVILLDGLTPMGVSFCDDCHAHTNLRAYGRVNACERCILGRMAVKRLHDAQETGAAA